MTLVAPRESSGALYPIPLGVNSFGEIIIGWPLAIRPKALR